MFPIGRLPGRAAAQLPADLLERAGRARRPGLVLAVPPHVVDPRSPRSRGCSRRGRPAVAATLCSRSRAARRSRRSPGWSVGPRPGHSRAVPPRAVAVVPTTGRAHAAYDADLLAGEQGDVARGGRRPSSCSTHARAAASSPRASARAVLLLGDAGPGEIGCRAAGASRARRSRLVLVLAIAGWPWRAGCRPRSTRTAARARQRPTATCASASWTAARTAAPSSGEPRSTSTARDRCRARRGHVPALVGAQAAEHRRGRRRALALPEMLAELGWPGCCSSAVGRIMLLAVAVPRLRGPERHAHAAACCGCRAAASMRGSTGTGRCRR